MHLIQLLIELVYLLLLPENDNNRSIVGESPMDRRAKWIWRCLLICLILIAFGIYYSLKRAA